ncbi:5-oxoprolinase subunit C family protein [Crocinitomix catalasitica]|uniref:5-oxoprolinase subunit C family protein n=1 Tax=Crocinitomix catalasitica TaxID=184607 RepID=UPI0004849EA5|nr:biotin-dependent carboxyltransferase family protein [Crocinitomix catalasitica]
MLELLSSGIHTTLQDAGRFGYRNFGIPLCGFMDQHSAKVANSLVGNSLNTVCLEFVHSGPILKFYSPTYIAICGAQCDLKLNDKIVQQNQLLQIKANDILKIGQVREGNYGYLAIAGGFNSTEIMGSSSFYPGITEISRLTKTMRVDYNPLTKFTPNKQSQLELIRIDQEIKVFEGPEFHQLSDLTKNKILSQKYAVSSLSNRMANRLETTKQIKGFEIISGPVQPGTIQLTPGGDFIVLMRDCQTTGGYARILQLSEMSINLLAQKKINTQFQIKII